MVDVVTETLIGSPTDRVAEYSADPANATSWYENIRSAQLLTAPPVSVGSQIAFEAAFLGRTLTYTYEVVELDPGRRLAMRTRDGPFEMETTYEWESADEGATRMTLRNRGNPSGFSKLVSPFMAAAMRRANRKDLRRLKEVLEAELDTSVSGA